MNISARVRPQAKFNSVTKLLDGSFEIMTTAPAKSGKANQSVIQLIAEYFSVAPSLVSIKSGLTSRHKIIKIDK